MRVFRAWLIRAGDLIRGRARDRDLDAEFESHVQLHVDDLVGSGVPAREARRRALAALGGLEATKARYRDRRGVPMLAETVQDVRYSMRVLRRSPGFTLGAVATLAVGIGFNTAIFSLVNAVMLAPLPVRAPEELAFVYGLNSNAGAFADYDQYRLFEARGEPLFSGVAAAGGDVTQFRTGVEIQTVIGEKVSGNYFGVLGIAPALGRVLIPADDTPDAQPVVVISDDLWRSHFNADPDVIGRALPLTSLNRSTSYQVVGVMPADFFGVSSVWEPASYWVAARRRAQDSRLPSPPASFHVFVARRQPGVTFEEVRAFAGTWKRTAPPGRRGRFNEEPALVVDAQRVRLPFDPAERVPPMWTIGGILLVSGLVLVIGVANLSGLVLARAVGRQHEIAVRVTLGAGRWRLARLLMIEGVLLGGAGSLVGLLLAGWLIRIALAGLPAGFTAIWASRFAGFGVPMDWRVLVFTAAVGILAGIIVGLTPLRQTRRVSVSQALGGGQTHASSTHRSRIRHWIVVPQIAFSLALVVVAAVALAELAKVASVPPGYEPDGVVFLQLDWWGIGDLDDTGTGAARAAAAQRVLEAARTSSALEAPALSDWWRPVRPSFTSPGPATAQVTSAYFDALRIPLIAGRTFNAEELRYRRFVNEPPPAAIVDSELASRLWPGQNAIGRRVAFGEGGESSSEPRRGIEVVGVVDSTRDPLSTGAYTPTLYFPGGGILADRYLLARARGTEAEAILALKAAVAEAAPAAGVLRSGTVRELIDDARYPRRLAASLLGFSAVVALILATLGVYGVVTCSIAQRTRELGIRAALGADQGDVIRLVLREGATTAMVGTVLGLALALGAAALVRSLVAEMPSMHPLAFVGAPVVLVAAILLAAIVSARRAARLDPLAALRTS